MACGIYKITNSVNGKVYIGSSKNISQRWKTHLYGLRNERHGNAKLQRAFQKYGEANFVFEILCEVEESQLVEVEQDFIDQYQAWKLGYNISLTAGRLTKAPFEGEDKARRTKRVEITFNEKEYLKLKANADAVDQAIAEFIRDWVKSLPEVETTAP